MPRRHGHPEAVQTLLELGANYVLNENWRFYFGGNWLDSDCKGEGLPQKN